MEARGLGLVGLIKTILPTDGWGPHGVAPQVTHRGLAWPTGGQDEGAALCQARQPDRNCLMSDPNHLGPGPSHQWVGCCRSLKQPSCASRRALASPGGWGT